MNFGKPRYCERYIATRGITGRIVTEVSRYLHGGAISVDYARRWERQAGWGFYMDGEKPAGSSLRYTGPDERT